MGCDGKKNGVENIINGVDNTNKGNGFNYFSRIITFIIGFILAPVILIGVYYLMFKHIIVNGSMTIDINSVLKYYADWKSQKKEDEDDMVDEEFDPEGYELITKVDKIN